MLIDVHAHLSSEFIKNPDEIISNSKNIKILETGYDYKTNRNALELNKKYDFINVSLGLHPTLVFNSKEEINKELNFIEKNRGKIKAIGETGLDFHQFKKTNYDNTKISKIKDLMFYSFESLIKIAKEHNIPIIIHSRDAELESIECLERNGVKKVVMHSFTGRKKLAERCVKNGWYFSIPTSIVRNKQYQELAFLVPLNRIFTESDCPFQSAFADKPSEPMFVKNSVEKIAEVKGLSFKETENIIFQNYLRLF